MVMHSPKTLEMTSAACTRAVCQPGSWPICDRLTISTAVMQLRRRTNDICVQSVCTHITARTFQNITVTISSRLRKRRMSWQIGETDRFSLRPTAPKTPTRKLTKHIRRARTTAYIDTPTTRRQNDPHGVTSLRTSMETRRFQPSALLHGRLFALAHAELGAGRLRISIWQSVVKSAKRVRDVIADIPNGTDLT